MNEFEEKWGFETKFVFGVSQELRDTIEKTDHALYQESQVEILDDFKLRSDDEPFVVYKIADLSKELIKIYMD